MVASMIQVESPSEESIPLGPVNPENGQLNTASEQRGPSHNEGSGSNEQNAGVHQFLSKRAKKIIIRIIIVIFVLGFLASIIGNIFQFFQNKQLEAKSKLCPRGWIMNAGWCYFFSDSDGTFNSSYHNCSSSGGSLLVMRAPEERTFIDEKTSVEYYWIGLQRANVSEPWKQPDGSDADVEFEIEGDGPCAYVHDGKMRSTYCDSQRHWICCKPVQAV